MNIVRAFADYLEDSGIATLGQDLYIGEAPSSNQAPDSLWWIASNGGAPEIKLVSGQMVKQYRVDVFYRDRNGQTVYDKLYDLEERLNNGCIEIPGFTTVEVDAETFPIDDDLDSEDRKVGLLQATLRIYKEHNYGIS